MKLIKCTFFDDFESEVYINVDFIEAIFEDELLEDDIPATKIITAHGMYFVEDSVKEVLTKISLAMIDRDYAPPKIIKAKGEAPKVTKKKKKKDTDGNTSEKE